MFDGGSELKNTMERRREIRFPTNLPAQLLDSTDRTLKEPRPARVLDISKNGLKIEVWHDALIGSCFSLALEYQQDDSLCVGEVVWKRETTRGMVYGLRVVHWTYLTRALANRILSWETKARGGDMSDLEVDMQDVAVVGNVVLPLHTDPSFGA